MRTVGKYVIDQLETLGVDAIFGVPGSDILGLLNALDRGGPIRFYSVHHEETAALMAAAYGTLTGRLGVVMTHSGPGAAHLVNGLYHASRDHVPVLALTGQVPTRLMGTRASQATDLGSMMAGPTMFSVTVSHPDSIGEVLTEALYKAIRFRGAVHVGIPIDLQEKPSQALLRPPNRIGELEPQPDPDGIQAAMALLRRARRPVIQAGQGSRGVGQEVLALAERLQAPIVTSLLGKGVVSEDHPLVMGTLGEAGTLPARDAVKSADTLLVMGSTWWPETLGFPTRPAQVIQIDQVPDSLGISSPVGIGLVGTLQDVLPSFLTAGLPAQRPRPWVSALIEAKDRWWSSAYQDSDEAFHPRTVLAAIARAVPDDAIMAVDTGSHTLWTGGYYPTRHETILASGRWRTMGYGLPAAMAAKIAEPESVVLAIVGDGGLSMALSDLSTAARYRLPIVVVVFNNGSLAMEVYRAQEQGQKAVGMGLFNPDFAAMAEAAHWEAKRVTPRDALARLIEEATQRDVPVLLDVPVRDIPPPFLD